MSFKKEMQESLELANGAILELADRVEYLERENQLLKTNGVATAINKLNEEVFKTKKEDKSSMHGIWGSLTSLYIGERKKSQLPTLAGKVDAIVEHLGLDITVKPEEVVSSKVVANKKVATKKAPVNKAKKRGRK